MCIDGGWSVEVSVKEFNWRAKEDIILSTCSESVDCIIATGYKLCLSE